MRKQWGLLLSSDKKLEDINTTMVGEWHVARTQEQMDKLVYDNGLPTHVYADGIYMALYFMSVVRSLQMPPMTTIPFVVYGTTMAKVELENFASSMTQKFTKKESYESMQKELESLRRENHDLKCELERVRTINEGLYKRLGV